MPFPLTPVACVSAERKTRPAPACCSKKTSPPCLPKTCSDVVPPDSEMITVYLICKASFDCKASKKQYSVEQHAGAGLVFLSALTHATGVSGKGIWKLTIFFGYILNIGVPKRRRDGT